MQQIVALDIANREIEAFYDIIPDECRMCHRGIVQINLKKAFVSARSDGRGWTGVLEVLFRCPKQDCARTFMAIYRQHVQNTGEREYFFFQNFAPITIEPPVVEE